MKKRPLIPQESYKLLTGFEPPKYIFANIRKKC